MQIEDAHGANKVACRNDTITQAKQYLGEDFKHEVFAVLLGPAAGDVKPLRDAGNTASIVGFEKNWATKMKAMVELQLDRETNVIHHNDVTRPSDKYGSAILDWCQGAETCLPLTKEALRANWRPHHGSHLTIGVSYGRTESAVLHDWCCNHGNDYAGNLALYIWREMKPFVHNWRLKMVGIRTYKSANRGTNMLYVSFRVAELCNGREPTPVRTHYKSLQPTEAAESVSMPDTLDETPHKIEGEEDMATANGTNAAKKAWATRRANELATKRSSAAKKAWATRRQNEAAVVAR